MKNKAKLLALIPIIFFSVSGGPYGLEEIVTSVGPINTLLLIVLLPIVWTIPESMIVAELSSTYPLQGGYYKWVQMGLGRFWGFMEGWWSILYTLIDLSLYPILFTTYLKLLFSDLNFLSIYLIQVAMIWLCALINILGIRIVGYFLTCFNVFILLFFTVFIICGLKHISFNFIPVLNFSSPPQINNLLFGLSLAFWNYIGWDNGSTVLEEVENPNVNYHKALFITIPIIVFFYFFPTLVGLCIHTDWQNWKFGEFSHIANSMNCPVLSVLITIGGMLTCLGLFNSLLLSSSRVFSSMATDKLLPSFFSKMHSSFNTPYLAIAFSAVIFSLLVLLNFQNLVIYDVFLYLIALLLEALALVSLRKQNTNIKTNFRIPFGNMGLYLIVGAACLVILFMLVLNLLNLSNSTHGTLFSILLIFSGVPFYLLFNRKN